MYCPKCGQETINIGGKEACTTCGVLYEKVTPVDQITSQIREKAINSIPKLPNEEYVSPTQTSQSSGSPKPASNDEEKSLDKFIKTWGQEEKNGEAPKENQEAPIDNTAPIPDFPTPSQKDSTPTPQEKEVLKEASDETVLNITEQNIPTKDPVPSEAITIPPIPQAIQSQKEETLSEESRNTENLVKEGSSSPEVSNNVPAQGTQQLPPNPQPQIYEKVISKEGFPENVIPVRPEFAKEVKVEVPINRQELFDETQLLMENSDTNTENAEVNTVYPSHKLNLAVIRAIIITVFIMLIIVAILYIYRANISFSDIVLNTATFIGENLFK